MPSLGQSHIRAVDVDGFALEGHRPLYRVHPLQGGQDIALMGPGGAEPDGGLVDIKGVKPAQKFRGVAPGDDFDLSPDAVGVDNLSGL